MESKKVTPLYNTVGQRRIRVSLVALYTTTSRSTKEEYNRRECPLCPETWFSLFHHLGVEFLNIFCKNILKYLTLLFDFRSICVLARGAEKRKTQNPLFGAVYIPLYPALTI